MNFLFISEMLPTNTYASEVVFYRHFKKLADEGHNIYILTDINSYGNRKKDISAVFKVHLLPNRKWYYPPYKPYGVLQNLRFLDYYKRTEKLINDAKIDMLIGYVFSDFLAPFCAFVQKRTNLPLISFFHDDTSELHFNKPYKTIRKNTEKILKASTTVLIASEKFKENWVNYSEKFTLLYPIPTPLISSHAISFTRKVLNVGYSGSVYNEIIPYLDKFSSMLNQLNINFTIIGNNVNANYLSEKYSNVKVLPLFETADEANEYLVKNCDMCVITYPEKFSEMPWIKTCFPSKFIQNSLLGIPSIVIAPKDSAIGHWCLTNKWLLFHNTYDSKKINYLLSITFNSSEVIDQVDHYRKNVFDPDIVHGQLVKEINKILF